MTEPKLNRIQTRGLAKVVELRDSPDNVVRVRVTREVADAYGTIFNVEGMDLSRMETEPGVYLGHNDRASADNLSIAKIENMERGVDEEGVAVLDADLAFDTEDPLAVVVARKMKAGFMSSVSIRAQIDPEHVERTAEGVILFQKSTLIGVDIVGRGGNKDSVVLGRTLDLEGEEMELFKQRFGPEETLKSLRADIEALKALVEAPQVVEPEEERTYLDDLLSQIPRGDDWLDDLEF